MRAILDSQVYWIHRGRGRSYLNMKGQKMEEMYVAIVTSFCVIHLAAKQCIMASGALLGNVWGSTR